MKKTYKSKITAIFTMIAMLFTLVAPATINANAADDGTVKLQILATSDMHGRFMPYDYAQDASDLNGSMTQLATIVKNLRSENANTILVDNGDTIQDNSSSLFLQDSVHPMIAAMNGMNYDSWTLGNHEFNYGMATLSKVISQAKMPVLCGNLYKDGKLFDNTKAYTIIDKAGVKVALIGMVTPHITKWDAENLTGYEVKNPANETRKVLDELKDKADVFILSVHAGENNEYGNGDGAREIAKLCPELTAIIAGHAHSSIDGVREGNVIITEPASAAKAISKIDVKVTKKDGKYVVANPSTDVTSKLVYSSPKGGTPVNPDPELTSVLASYNDRAIQDSRVVIGELKGGDLAPANEVKGIPESQLRDSAMLDLINKVQMFYGKADVSSAALFKDDANMKKGPISKSGTASIYKFDNTLKVLEVTGAQLKKYMEWSASYYNTFKPGDLTISFNENVRNYNYDMFAGLKYDINISKEAGNRIENLTYATGKKVNDSDIIKLAVNNYRADTTLLNKDSGLFKGENVKVLFDSQKAMGDDGRIRDLIRKYIVEEKKGVITPECDNSWKLTGFSYDKAQRELAKTLINNGKLALPRSTDGRTPNVRAITMKDVEEAQKTVIDLLSINDFHGSLKSEGKNIGAAKLAGEIKRLQKANPNTIFVSAGDLYQGSAMSNLKKGAPVSDMLKELKLEASAVGNHEFDWSRDLLTTWAKDGNFDFLASNIYDKKTNKPVEWAKPYKVVVRDGKKIGLIGIATPETAFKSNPANVADLEFKNPTEATNTWAKYLRETEKVDAVIVLSHLGAVQDAKTKVITGEAAELANTAKGIDGIICGHSHQYINGTVNNIPVVQGMYNGRAIAKLSVVFSKEGNLLSVTPDVLKLYERKDLVDDAAVKAIYDKYDSSLAPLLNEVVTTLPNELPHDRTLGLSPLGQFITREMTKISKTDIALVNGGGLRAPLAKGDLTVGKLYEVMPFDNTLVTMKLKGSDLKRVIENGIMNKEVGWIQFYGLKVYYDKDKAQGSRITSMRLLNGTPIEMDKYYTVSTIDFMYAKGDNYDFTGATNVVDTNIPLRDSVTQSLKGQTVNFTFDDKTLNASADTSVKAGSGSIGKADKLPQTGSSMGYSDVLALGALITLVGASTLKGKKSA